MVVEFPLKDVVIREVDSSRTVSDPVLTESYWQMNQDEFAMQVEGVGSFYACHGNFVEYSPCTGTTTEEIELYLNGSVYGAILHQRRMLPFHASSVAVDGAGIMICGDTGSGKSSLTLSMALNGSGFLTDDVTPVVLTDGRPFVLAVSDRIKLWKDSFDQMGVESDGLKRISPETDKFYLPVLKKGPEKAPLVHVIVLSVHNGSDVKFRKVEGARKVLALRNEIYRREYLEGMRQNEGEYFRQLIRISARVNVTEVSRPSVIPVNILNKKIMQYLNG